MQYFSSVLQEAQKAALFHSCNIIWWTKVARWLDIERRFNGQFYAKLKSTPVVSGLCRGERAYGGVDGAKLLASELLIRA